MEAPAHLNPATSTFLNSLRDAGRHESTLRQHQRNLDRFFRYLSLEGAGPADKADLGRLVPVYCDGVYIGTGPANRLLVERFLLWACADQSDRERAAALRNQLLNTLRSFFQHLLGSGILMVNPTEGVAGAKVRLKVNHRKYLTPAESATLLESAAASGEHRARNFAIMTTLLRAGLRPGELCHLTGRDLDFKACLIHVTGKTGFRSAPMVQPLARVLEAYVRSQYYRERCQDDGPLFPSSRSVAMETTELREMIKDLCERAGIDRGVTTYWTRHTFATDARRAGVIYPVISQAMGHVKVATTHTYVHIRESEMRALAERGPAAIPFVDVQRALLRPCTR